MENQSPCSVPGTLRISATPLPVNSALAGHAMTLSLLVVSSTSSTPAVPMATRIWAIDRPKPMLTWPRTWTVTSTPATCSRGSFSRGGCRR